MRPRSTNRKASHAKNQSDYGNRLVESICDQTYGSSRHGDAHSTQEAKATLTPEWIACLRLRKGFKRKLFQSSRQVVMTDKCIECTTKPILLNCWLHSHEPKVVFSRPSIHNYGFTCSNRMVARNLRTMVMLYFTPL
jgi:hypothetical protein